MKKKSLLMTAVAMLGLTTATMAQSASYCNASLSLDGIDDFGAISNVFFQNINQRDFTIEFYLKADASQTQYPGIWGKTGFWSEINVELYVPGKVRCFYATTFGGNQYFGTDTVSWSSNVWDHYAVVGDGNLNQLRIYKNGVLDASTPHGTPDWSLPNNDSKIGAVFQGWTGPNTQYLNGRIDDFRVSDIARYSSNFTAPQNLSADSNTRVLYSFNSISSGIVPDLSGNNNNLTLQNGAILDANDVPYGAIGNSITNQPSNLNINIGSNTQFIVGSSSPSATFQWQTDLGVGFQNLNSVGQYSGTTNDTLTVSNVTMSNNNQPFRCIVSSGSCSDTSNVAVLTVNNNVGINETSRDNLLSVFPNPAQSIINVKTDSKLLGSVYSIIDNKGRIVQTGKINSGNTTIELGNLSSGIYMFSVGENMKQNFRLIKE
jgi:hypothetical protein